MDFEKNVYVVTLFDLYGELLTDKQQQCLRDYLVDDLTLTEISQNLGVTRQAVNCRISEAVKILQHFEDVLHLSAKLDKLEAELNADNIPQSVTDKILDIMKE